MVISDVYLGSYGCRAKELTRYMSTIDPSILILNGNIIDGWQLEKKYWPASHMLVVKQVISMLSRGVKVFYITGNHDTELERFAHFTLGDFHLEKQLVLRHEDGQQTLVVHGDGFEITGKFSRWLSRLSATGFSAISRLKSFKQFMSRQAANASIITAEKPGLPAKQAEKQVKDFEQTAAAIALQHKYNRVICGHIQKPEKKTLQNNGQDILYMNSGDWVNSLTALECNNGDWNIYRYNDDPLVHEFNDAYYQDEAAYLHTAELFKMMLHPDLNF